MKKYTFKDIEIKTPGVQIRDRIIEEFGSIFEFSKKIDLYETSINQYLFSKDLGSSTFKIRVSSAFNQDFHRLYLTEEEQIRKMSSDISWYIDLYNQYKDLEIFEKLKKICLEKEFMEDYAIVCRCFARYYWNQGKKDRALAYIEVSSNIMRSKENIDRFGLYLSEYIWMNASFLGKSLQAKEESEFNKVIEKVKGPLTTGHMYYNLGSAFASLKNYEKSKSYYLKVLDYHHDEKSRASVYMSLGDMEKEIGSSENALENYKIAETLLEKEDEALKSVYHEYAIYYYENGNIDLAERYIDMVFQNEKSEISSTDNEFLITFCKIKIDLEKTFEALDKLERFLGEIEGEYIYLEKHLLKLEELIGWQRNNRVFLIDMSKLIIKHYKSNEKGLSEEIKTVLKIVLGSIEINI